MRFSASRLKAYMECSLAAHYTYDEGRRDGLQNAKAAFGTIMHGCLEVINSIGYLATVKQFKDHWDNPEKAGLPPETEWIWPKYTSRASLRVKGLEILDRYHQQHRFDNSYLIGTEIPFLVPFGDHELTGFIDKLETRRSGTGNETLNVVDYKTNGQKPSPSALALDVQFTTYAYAVRQKSFWVGVDGNPDFPGVPNGEWLWETIGSCMPIRCIWYHLYTCDEIDAGPRLEIDFQRLYRVCEEIRRATEAQVFVPKIGEACRYCNHQDICVMDIPPALAALNDDTDPNRYI